MEVFYLDVGDKKVVPRSKLALISEEHTELPFQAIECQLSGIKPKGELSYRHCVNTTRYVRALIVTTQ